MYLLEHLPIEVLEDHQAVHRFYHQVLFVMLFLFLLFLVNVCVWVPYKIFEGVNASGESGGALGIRGIGAGF